MIDRRDGLKLALGLPLLAGTGLVPFAAGAQGADYPSKPIELIIPFAPGGGLDLFGRTVAKVLTDEGIVKQRIQITNMPGAGGARGMATMVQRKGDAYSLLAIALHVHLTPLMQNTPHSYKDMTALAKLYTEYNLIVVRTESPIKSLKEVAEAIKADPGKLRFGGATIGNSDHITVSRLAQLVGADPTKLTYVAYSGGESNAAILGGHVDVGLGGPDMMDLVDAGKMRVLGVTAPARLTGRMKDVPTFREQGFDITLEIWRGMFGPPDMPDYAVKFWRDAFAKMVATPAWKSELEKNQWSPVFQTADFRASLDTEHESYRKLLQQLGLIK